MRTTSYLEIYGFSIYELRNNDGAIAAEFTINQKNFSGSLQDCVDLACENFAQKNGRSGAQTQGFAQCPENSEPFINIHGVSVNVKKDQRGCIAGYFVSSHEEDLSSLQGAVNTACGLFCIQYNLVNEEGDPMLEAPKTERKPGGYDIEGADDLLETDNEIIQLFNDTDI